MSTDEYKALQKRMKGGDSIDTETTGRTLATRSNVKAGAASAKTRSYLESMLDQHLTWANFERAWITEYEFDPCRKWRIDFAWINQRLAVEVQGEIHRIKSRFDADIEKIQALTLAGWRYLPLSSKDIRTGNGVLLIEKALKL